jgi:hypothetical protein
LLRDHFSSVENLEFNSYNVWGEEYQLENYIYVGDGQGGTDRERTGILIDPVWLFNAEDMQRRPGLIIKRGAFQTRKTGGIGDGTTSAPVTDGNGRVVRVPGRYQTRAILGSHVVFAIAGAGAEAELLGSEVFNFFSQFAQVIRQTFKMAIFTPSQVGEVSVVEEYDHNFVVPIVLSYAVHSAWRIDVKAPWFKTAQIEVSPR